ncbi:hypothetical protein AEM51_09915 [Bacteroidetes bacterium UKL13-3]|nr:hypothetical protein AEM51_09915 [Bacteroidetes bacterium UKL13-3]
MGKSNLLFFRISVLCNDVTGITGKHNVLLFAFGTRTDFDHFVDVNKMVGNLFANGDEAVFRLGYDVQKISPFRVS